MLLIILGLFAVVTTCAARDSSCRDLPFPPAQQDVDSFLSRKYDYLIVGGGTAGVAVASRLAERTPLQIGVIEAGAFHHNDPNVDVPSNFVNLSSPSYDWNFTSSPQTHAGMRNITIPRGKMLGGSSGRNQMAVNRATTTEYDAWSFFSGTNNWTWNGLLPYFRSTERMSPTDPFASFSQGSTDLGEDLHGFRGPISASVNELYSAEIPSYIRTLNQLGIKTVLEPDNGNALGVYNVPLSVDRLNGVRSYAASEYYCNQPRRSNLHILTGAQVTRIVFNNGSSIPTATGVEFSVPGLGGQFKSQVAREVILSAGAVQTPQILELSGIGNSSLLQNLGIPIVVDNPAVGENFQEHLFFGVQSELVDTVQNFDALRKNATFMAEQQAVYNTSRSGFLAALDCAVTYIPLQNLDNQTRVDELLGILETELATVNPQSLTALQYGLQRDWIKSGNVSMVEMIAWSRGVINPQPDKGYLTILGGIMHPLSRGSVHITTKDPLAAPKIDPGFLTSDFDMEVLFDVMKFIQKIGQESPLSSLIKSSIPSPGSDDDSLREFIRGASSGASHLIGTAALAPAGMGGVVDASLRVHGTSNLRVVDASIFPNHISAHTQATVYAVAEATVDQIIQHL